MEEKSGKNKSVPSFNVAADNDEGSMAGQRQRMQGSANQQLANGESHVENLGYGFKAGSDGSHDQKRKEHRGCTAGRVQGCVREVLLGLHRKFLRLCVLVAGGHVESTL
jgi:hypothetical protein